jgi:F-type H+-transporting ATPase subunit gamma
MIEAQDYGIAPKTQNSELRTHKMALKEVKERINSVKSTRKTTSAMKMVASAKLHKAQGTIAGMLPYSQSLHHVMESLLSGDFTSVLCEQRPVERVAIVAYSSDSSLCGAFNANVIREMVKAMDRYASLPNINISLYTIGKKVYDAARKKGYSVTKNFPDLAAKPKYDEVADLASELIRQFSAGEVDCVELIYHHFKTAATQTLEHQTMLPLTLPKVKTGADMTDYILEPSRQELLDSLIPKSIKLQMFTALLDSNASEHAARMLAMQAATDNADDLISDLTIEYNKSRQQAITSELLDIIGGSFGRQ